MKATLKAKKKKEKATKIPDTKTLNAQTLTNIWDATPELMLQDRYSTGNQYKKAEPQRGSAFLY